MAGYEIMYNPDETRFGVTFPDGDESELMDVPNAPMCVLPIDADNLEAGAILITFDGVEEPLKPNTVYELKPCDTEVTEVADEEEEEDDDSDSDSDIDTDDDQDTDEDEETPDEEDKTT